MQLEICQTSVHSDATSGRFEHWPVVNLIICQWSKRPPKQGKYKLRKKLRRQPFFVRPCRPRTLVPLAGLRTEMESYILHRWRRMSSEGFARPLTSDVHNAGLFDSVHRCVALLDDRRRHALVLLDELRADRDRFLAISPSCGLSSTAITAQGEFLQTQHHPPLSVNRRQRP